MRRARHDTMNDPPHSLQKFSCHVCSDKRKNMGDPGDFSIRKLEQCAYRYLQQIAKSFGLPSNVKKMYLIEMIHAKKYRSEEEFNSIVFRIKEERKQLVKPRKPSKRKKKRLQDTEISSTSNQSPISMDAQPTDYIVTYPPSSPNNHLTLLKHKHPNVLRQTIVKKQIESDRVLRSFNNRFRTNYSFLNLSNSVIGVIKSQNAVQRSEVQERQCLSVALERHNPLDMGECVERPRPVYRDYSVKRRQIGFVDVDKVEGQLVPVPRSSNVSPRPAKRLRRISGIYPLKPPELPYYHYVPNVGFRREDGRISKINALAQKPAPRPTSDTFLCNKTTQTYAKRKQLPPNRSLVKNVAALTDLARNGTQSLLKNVAVTMAMSENYRNDQLINSSTVSARDIGIERENSSQQNSKINHGIETLNEPKSSYTESLVYQETETRPTESVIRYTTSNNYAEENPIRYVENRHHAIQNMRHRCAPTVNQNDHIETRNFAPIKASRTETCNYNAVNQNKYTDNNRFAAENLSAHTETRSKFVENPVGYPEAGAMQNPNTDKGSCATISPRYLETRGHATNMYSERNNIIDNPHRYIETDSHISENHNRYPEMANTLEYPNRYTENSGFIPENLNRYTENSGCIPENLNRYTENSDCISENLHRYTETETATSDYVNRYREARNYTAETQNTESSNSESPKHTESRNDAIEILNDVPDNVSRLTENNTLSNIQKETWNVSDYPNMSALTDIDTENQATNLTVNDSSGNFSIYYHKKIRAEQIRSQRLSYSGTNVPRELSDDNQLRDKLPGDNLPGDDLPGDDLPGDNLPGDKLPGDNLPGDDLPGDKLPENKLPPIADVFSQFSDPCYRHLTQPLYVQVSEESERIQTYSLRDSVVLEKFYNCPSHMLGVSNKPLLRLAPHTTATICVYSAPVITTAIAHPSAAACNEYNTHPYERVNQQYRIEPETVPRLYDYLRIAEQEQMDFKCYEPVSSATDSVVTTPSQLGANVTNLEMVEDALELISQDGDYMERIEMDVRMQCILCEWAGPKIIMEHHFTEEHSSSIIERVSTEWRAIFTLGGLLSRDTWISELSKYGGRVFVLSARYVDDCFMAILTVLPKATEEFPKTCRLTVYNKVTGEPNSWEGDITYLPDSMPYETDLNGLKLDITGLNLLPNSANLKLVNGEFVVNSTAKVVVGHPELDNIEIAVYVKVFD